MSGSDRITDQSVPQVMPADRPRKILVADDQPGIRILLVTLCEQMGYQSVEASTGAEAVSLAHSDSPDLILMDAMMPDLDGFEATRRLKASPQTAPIPILILTGLKSREDRLKGIAAGASDFLSKPIDSEELMLRVKNNLQVKEFHDFLKHHAGILEEQVADRTRRLKESVDTLQEAHRTTKAAHLDTIYRLSALAEFRDEDTGVHIKRIGYYAQELGAALGLDEKYRDLIFHAAMMHDIGKVAVPDAVLLKPGKLTDEEWDTMRAHTSTGARILEGSNSPYLLMGAEIAQNHHERWDGSGYPRGIAGEAIPLSARIVALVDSYDALRSVRPYKPSFDHIETVNKITEGDGRTVPEHFDPTVMAAFKKTSHRFEKIFAEQQD